MLKTSEVARRLNITNSQVQDLVDFGYLPVAGTYYTRGKGLGYLFAEGEIESLDVFSILAEIKDKKERRKKPFPSRESWQKRQRIIRRHEQFLRSTADLPEGRLLRAAYYLFHLNHYAKAYPNKQEALYSLKDRVLARMVDSYPDIVRRLYLVGDDLTKIWLCEDCRQAARAAGCSYLDYLKEGNYCGKCYTQVLEREYYSLVEFSIEVDDYLFCFHLPYGVARKWLKGIERLPRRERKHDKAGDKMYFYGRPIARIEEKVVPLPVVIKELKEFIEGGDDSCG